MPSTKPSKARIGCFLPLSPRGQRWEADLLSGRFEVGQYTAALREVTESVRELNGLLVSTHALVTSPDLSERLGQVQTVTDSGLGRLDAQGNRFIDRIFWRGIGLVAAFFVGLVLYRAASLWMSRRFTRS